MSFARSARKTYFDDVTKNKENLPGPERYNPNSDERIKGFKIRDQSVMDMSAINGTYQCEKSMLGPPNSTPSKEPFKIAKRAGKKSAVTKSLEMSMTQEMGRYKDLESEYLRVKQNYQRILDLKDELEENYSKAREESQKVPKLMHQVDSLQNALEVSKTKAEEIKILEDQIQQLKQKEEEEFKQVTEKEAQLVALKGQVMALEARLAESESTLKNKSDELQKANIANFNHEHKIAELEPLKQEVALLREDSAVYTAEIRGLNETLKEAHAALKTKESENASLKRNVGSQINETDVLKNKLDQMTFELDEQVAIEKDLRDVQGATEARVRELMASVSEKEDEISCLNEKIKSQQDALVSATESSSVSEQQKTAKIEELNKECETMKESRAQKLAELEAKISENHQISDALEDAKSALALEYEKIKKAEEVYQAELKAISEARQIEKSGADARILELEKLVHAKDSQIIQIEDLIKATTDENVELLAKIKESESVTNEFEEKLKNAESAQSDLSSGIARLKNELEEAKAKNVCSSEEFDSLKAEVESLRASSKNKEAKFVKLVNEKHEMAKENNLLREHGAKYMTKRDNLRIALNEQQKKIEELDDFKNNHEGTLAALQQKLKQTESEKQNFRAQLTVAERKVADATIRTKEIDDLKAKLADADTMCEKWKAEYEEQENFYAPIRADLAKFAEESRHWGSENAKKSKELAALNSKMADQMSHANHKQKIKYMNKIKDENELLKEKLSLAECQMKKIKKENDALRDDLNVVRNVKRFDPKKAFSGKQ